MFNCAHDPGLAVFLSETAAEDLPTPGPLEWAAVAGTVVFALLALALSA